MKYKRHITIISICMLALLCSIVFYDVPLEETGVPVFLEKTNYLTECGTGVMSTRAVTAETEADYEGVVIRSGNPETNQLTFTCNVDWGEEVIPGILELLKEEDIKITFFVCGRWAENHPDLLRRMYLNGHEIQSHGYAHKLCTKVSTEEVREEIQKTEDVIWNILGIKTNVFAPPSGDFNDSTVALCKEMGYTLSLWSADTIDWKEGSTAQIITERILKKEHKGAIVLMHPKEATLEALPGLIKTIRDEGIEIVPLNTMLKNS